jgi:23S rRNA (adenine2030-N6)-methyltransferase
MEPVAMRAFERGIVATGIAKILQLELSVLADEWTGGMRGCGMLVANPPFGFEETAAPMLGWLVKALSQDSRSGTRVRWLVAE